MFGGLDDTKFKLGRFDMQDKKRIMREELADLLLTEAKRQDGFVHDTAARLTTKIGLYLVFCAFIFNGETSLINLSSKSSVGVREPFVVTALALVFFSILILLRAASIQSTRFPPLIERMREQFQEMDTKYKATGKSKEESISGLKGKLMNSLSRCIQDNHERNQRVSKQIKVSSILLGLSVLCLILSVKWPWPPF